MWFYLVVLTATAWLWMRRLHYHGDCFSLPQPVFYFRPASRPTPPRLTGPAGAVERVRENMMKRATGYCENTNCEDYAKGVFLLNHGDTFHCPRCRYHGRIEAERGHYYGSADYFTEVRVEYNYDPITLRYREIAIVKDESLPSGCTYTLHSPLIKTENRALKVAEAVLASLNRFGLEDGIPKQHETLMSFDKPRDEFRADCEALELQLEKSPLRRHHAH